MSCQYWTLKYPKPLFFWLAWLVDVLFGRGGWKGGRGVIPKCFTYKQLSFLNKKFTSGRGLTIKTLSHSQERRETNCNYRPVSLIPIIGKIFKKNLIKLHFWTSLRKRSTFLAISQAFQLSDLCESQLFFIVHDIIASFA